MIIAISRESGSGGGEIGHKLADAVGIPCYDKTVTEFTASISGFAKDVIEKSADKTPLPFDYSGYYYFYDTAGSEKWLPVYDQIYLAQSKAILRLAGNGDCVIVGRCAAHVLAEKGIPCISVFIHAPLHQRIERIIKRHNCDEKAAAKFIKKNDKARAAYYRKYAEAEWGRIQNYDMAISSELGIDKCVEIIAKLREIRSL